MIPVSAEFHEQALSDYRRFFGKVEIDYTDWRIDSSVDVTSAYNNHVSYPSNTANGILEPGAQWFSLEVNDLSGDYKVMPDDSEAYLHEVGWWSAVPSDSSGSFTTPPVLVIEHQPRPIRSLSVTGESLRGEYPVDFTIRLYAGELLVRTETVTGNSSMTWSLQDIEHLGVTRQELEISKWSHPGKVAKILEFFTSIRETYYGDMIYSISLTEDREVSSGTLPFGTISANEVEITLDNSDRRFDEGNMSSPLRDLLLPNRRVKPYLGQEINGEMEWVPLGTFYAVRWEVPKDSVKATVVARDHMERLRNSEYSISTVQVDTTLYDLAIDVLQDAIEGGDGVQFTIDPSYDDITVPYAWFEPGSHREALRVIAEAGGGVAFVDRMGKAVLDRPPYEAQGTLELTRDHIFHLNIPHKPDEVSNRVEVVTNPLTFGPQEKQYEQQETFDLEPGQTFTFTAQFTQTPVIDHEVIRQGEGSPEDFSVSVVNYAWGSEISVTNISATAKTGIWFEIWGKVGKVDGRERVIKEDEGSILDNGRKSFVLDNNPLIQSRGPAADIADMLISVYADPRRDCEVTWLGDPSLTLGDKIRVPTYQDGSLKEYIVISNRLEWDGSLRMETKGRKA